MTIITPTTTEIVVICPRCALAVVLPLLSVDVEVGDEMMIASIRFATTLTATLAADGPHRCEAGV